MKTRGREGKEKERRIRGNKKEELKAGRRSKEPFTSVYAKKHYHTRVGASYFRLVGHCVHLSVKKLGRSGKSGTLRSLLRPCLSKMLTRISPAVVLIKMSQATANHSERPFYNAIFLPVWQSQTPKCSASLSGLASPDYFSPSKSSTAMAVLAVPLAPAMHTNI